MMFICTWSHSPSSQIERLSWSVCTPCSLCAAILIRLRVEQLTVCRHIVRLYVVSLVYSHLGPSLRRGAACVQPFWSVSTLCNLCTAILIRLYLVQLVCSRFGPFLHDVACVQQSRSVSTLCIIYVTILVRLYTVQVLYNHLGPSLRGTSCVYSCSHIGPSLYCVVCVVPSRSVCT
jgi:hypothetical protein